MLVGEGSSWATCCQETKLLEPPGCSGRPQNVTAAVKGSFIYCLLANAARDTEMQEQE